MPLPSLDLSKGGRDFINDTALTELLAQKEPDAAEVRAIIQKSLNKEPLNLAETASLLNTKDKELIKIIFEGNGFMRYQIRNMVGTAVAVANKKEDISFIKNHLNDKKSREIIAYKAPAVGLYLVDVIY